MALLVVGYIVTGIANAYVLLDIVSRTKTYEETGNVFSSLFLILIGVTGWPLTVIGGILYKIYD